MTMEKKKLIPAPFDEKNITTDWIEELFDDQSALYGKHKMLGFMAGAAVLASWSGNCLTWNVLDSPSTSRMEAIKKLRERYWERYPKEESPFIVEEKVYDGLCAMRFYWKPEE